jgi:hypothetical protein
VRALLLGDADALEATPTPTPTPTPTGGFGVPDASSSAVAVAECERLLLSGRRGDALEVAMASELWAHAMLLATPMGAGDQKRVATRFARRSEERRVGKEC